MPDKPLILAVEPDRRQAAAISALARGQLNVDLILVDRAEPALDALADRVPDLVLTSLLLSPRDEAALTKRLRELDLAGAHVQTLMIPVLATGTKQSVEPSGILTRLRRKRTKGASPDGCDPMVFGAQITEYLERGAAERRDRPASATAKQRPTSEPDLASVDRTVEGPLTQFASERDTTVHRDTNSHVLRDIGILDDSPLTTKVAAGPPAPTLTAAPPAPVASAVPAARVLDQDRHEVSWEHVDAVPPEESEAAPSRDALAALEPTDSDLAEFVAVLQSMSRSEHVEERPAALAADEQPDEQAFWMLPPRAMWPRLESLVAERPPDSFVDDPQPVLAVAVPAPVKAQSRRPLVKAPLPPPRVTDDDTAMFDPDQFGFTALLAKLENSTL